MKSSYKIALLLAAGLLVFVLGYYATQDEEPGSGDRVTGPTPALAAERENGRPALAAAANGNAPPTAPASPALRSAPTPPPSPAPGPAPAAGPNGGDEFFADLKRSLAQTQNDASNPGGAAAPAPAPTPAPTPAAGPAEAARPDNGLNLGGPPAPAAASGPTGANTSAAAPAPAPAPVPAPAPAPRPTPVAAPAPTPVETPEPAASTVPSDGRPYFGPIDSAPRPASAPRPSAATPRPPATPASPERARIYVVRSGDTFERIAARELGDATRWDDVAQANPRIDPTKLKVGQEIRLPGPGSAATAQDEPRDAVEERRVGEGVTYTVKLGDTLSSIAQQYYSDANAWRPIFDANRRILKRESDLKPGQELVIPPAPRRE